MYVREYGHVPLSVHAQASHECLKHTRETADTMGSMHIMWRVYLDGTAKGILACEARRPLMLKYRWNVAASSLSSSCCRPGKISRPFTCSTTTSYIYSLAPMTATMLLRDCCDLQKYMQNSPKYSDDDEICIVHTSRRILFRKTFEIFTDDGDSDNKSVLFADYYFCCVFYTIYFTCNIFKSCLAGTNVILTITLIQGTCSAI